MNCRVIKSLTWLHISNLKIFFQELIQEKYEEYKSNDGDSHQSIDLSLPGRRRFRGSFHPTTVVLREISRVFTEMGFDSAEGPEVELDEYNFQKLNYLKIKYSYDFPEEQSSYSAFRLKGKTHLSMIGIVVTSLLTKTLEMRHRKHK